MQNIAIFASIGVAAVAVVYALILINVISKKPSGSKKMTDIAKAIADGAKAYLRRQYSTIALTIVVIFTVLLYLLGWKVAVGFLLGAILSATAGYLGMTTATKANVRTTQAARSSIGQALSIAFSSGMVMGLMVVSFGLFISATYWLIIRDIEAIIALGFGGSLVALFARVGGGIYTKAADVGADISGKIEAGIPEDDPRNPAVIADNVGDNVGDVAGMGADLYESYVDSIVVAMVLGIGLFAADRGIIIPLLIAAAGILSSILGSVVVRISRIGIALAMNCGIYLATILAAAASYLIARYLSGDLRIFYVVLVGLLVGIVIGFITEYFTSNRFQPVRNLAKSATGGTGPSIITGLALGMLSSVAPVLVVAAAIIIAYKILGLYGIALSAVGMLSTLGITLAADTYGPVADNAAGISEMAGLEPEVRAHTEALDAVGNTTAAIGKGFAIGSAALTALALFAGYTQAVGLSAINLLSSKVIAGLLLGAMLPFIFSSLAMQAVGQAAERIVAEVRRQFREIAGLLSGKTAADYKNCIKISTDSALRKMALPSLLAIASPVLVGFVLGPEALGGLLAGGVASGFLLALFMANAGGAWDNAKKYIESGNFGGKGSSDHKAAVIGDTVGDPLKDTAGPSLNILIKLMSIVAFLIAPLIITTYSLKVRAIVLGVIIVAIATYLIIAKYYGRRREKNTS